MCGCHETFDPTTASKPDGNAIKFQKGSPYEHGALSSLSRHIDGLSDELRDISLKIHAR